MGGTTGSSDFELKSRPGGNTSLANQIRCRASGAKRWDTTRFLRDQPKIVPIRLDP